MTTVRQPLTKRRRLSLVFGVVLLLTAMLQPGAAFAADGQVLAPGSDIAGNVFISGGHARINFANLGDCPVGLANCWVEVRFRWNCQEAWCFTWEESPWYRVPAGQDFYTHPGCADGNNKWEAKVRLHFLAPTLQTVRFNGGYEYHLGVNGVIPKYLFDVSTGGGYNGGIFIAQVTSQDAYAGESVLGQSSGYIVGPPSC
jgi:hypothetical protein